MKTKKLEISYQEYSSLEELRPEDRELAIAAIEAMKGAYAPYSNFCVGAAVRLEDGTVVTGGQNVGQAGQVADFLHRAVAVRQFEQVEIGIRPGEKLHEQMIGVEDAHFTYEYPEHFKILPQICNWCSFDSMIKGGKQVPEGFSYTSDNNTDWMTIPQLQEWIEKNRVKIGSI